MADTPYIEGADPGPYIVDGDSGDAGKFEPGIDDLTRPLRIRLGDYLSKNTVDGHTNGYSPTRGNSYTVKPGSTDYSFSTEDGRPVPLLVAGGRTESENAFSPLAGELDTEFGASQLFDDGTGEGRTLGDMLSKGSTNPAAEYTGHTLLKDGVIPGALGTAGAALSPNQPSQMTDSPVSLLVSQALVKNRWNPRAGTTPFDPEGRRASDARVPSSNPLQPSGQTTESLDMPFAGYQKKLGEYDPDATGISFDQLRRVGFSLMLKAAGEPGANAIGDLNQIDPLSAAASLTLAPGAAQMGIPRGLGQVKASDAYGAPGILGGADPGEPSATVRAGAGVGTPTLEGLVPFTFGSFNHYLEPFSKDVVASRALAGALALSVALAMKPAQGILSLLLEPVTTLEAVARINPIGASKIGTRLVLPIGIIADDVVAHLDAPGAGPLLHKGRSSRRNIIFAPAVWEALGFVVPDNQAGLFLDTWRKTEDGKKNDLGTKWTSYFFTAERGIAVMFGIPNVGQAPGFYITVAREMIRDIILTGYRAAKRIEQATTAGTSAGGAMNAVSETLMDMIDSKLVKFVNVMVTMGNASLKASPGASLGAILAGSFAKGTPIRGNDGTTTMTAPDNVAVSAVNALPTGFSLSDASAAGNLGRGTGWRTGNALSMLVLPDEFRNASALSSDQTTAAREEYTRRKEAAIDRVALIGGALPATITEFQINGMFGLGGYPGVRLRTPGRAYDEMVQREDTMDLMDTLTAGAATDVSTTSNFRIKNKISTDDRIQIEAELEAEYMPFYFHDLRTNEIVAFQAFLESLQDSFAVSHSSTDAYGRIDSVMIYKSTKRTISLSFTIACTNHVDFDIMYAKINKLVTLIYPQWSPGRVLAGENDTKFIQPFSQIPTASPVIRLRIGDIIRTNYSKFNLLRLFGMGTDNFSVGSADGESIREAQVTSAELAQSKEAALAADTDFQNFTSEKENPILRSFKAVGGKGLAGVITALNFDWLGGNTWEVARYSSRAPKLCKVTVGFSPIHDIAPRYRLRRHEPRATLPRRRHHVLHRRPARR